MQETTFTIRTKGCLIRCLYAGRTRKKDSLLPFWVHYMMSRNRIPQKNRGHFTISRSIWILVTSSLTACQRFVQHTLQLTVMILSLLNPLLSTGQQRIAMAKYPCLTNIIDLNWSQGNLCSNTNTILETVRRKGPYLFTRPIMCPHSTVLQARRITIMLILHHPQAWTLRCWISRRGCSIHLSEMLHSAASSTNHNGNT